MRQVRLQSVTSKKYVPPWPILLLIFLSLGLAFFGVKSWYFPNARTWYLAAPFMVASVIAAILIIPRSAHLYPTRWKKLIAAATLLIVMPLLSGVAYGVGAPALVLRLKGPDRQILATVLTKRTATRRCRRKIELTGYQPAMNHRLCLSAEEFATLRQGKNVLLDTREGYFGILAFNIKPAD
jgi:predicted membrane channel-forming protein YqfA (hemolysin III family)